MITISFKNVGQGDSIIIEWNNYGERSVGIIDCNISDEGNPTLNYIIENSITSIEFIVLSHFHYDHFSGLADIFEYCIKKNIKVKFFYHTITPIVLEIYNRIFTSQKLQKGISRFFNQYELFDKYVIDKIPVTCHIHDFDLNGQGKLSFLAPEGRTYDILSKQLSRKINRITTSIADINKLATIICIHNNLECSLLTSDAVKSSFRKISNKITKRVNLVQVPHHGSFKNIYPKFWTSLNKRDNCPAIFSIGYEPKDKLPDKETVEFFNTIVR